jgi:hypothetical protein
MSTSKKEAKSSITTVKHHTSEISPDEFAGHHSIMMLLLIIFFGILIYRFSKGRLRAMTKVEGTVKAVFHSQTSPPLSFVKIEYTHNGKKVTIEETLPKVVAKNDVVEFYVTSSGQVIFSSMFPVWAYWIVVIVYLLILLMSLGLVIHFNFMKSS